MNSCIDMNNPPETFETTSHACAFFSAWVNDRWLRLHKDPEAHSYENEAFGYYAQWDDTSRECPYCGHTVKRPCVQIMAFRKRRH